MNFFSKSSILLLGLWATAGSSLGLYPPSQHTLTPPNLDHPSSTPYQPLPLLELHKQLTTISSITYNETHVGHWLAHYLRTAGLTVELLPVSTHPSRFNVFAYIGNQRQTRLLLSSHIDTVPPFWPYEYRQEPDTLGDDHDHKPSLYNDEDEIWGRGSVDAKGSVATQITAFAALRAMNHVRAGDVALLFVVGEETGGDGMRSFSDHAAAHNLCYEAAIFGEPTELKLAAGHKGNLGFTLTCHGKAGHSGYPSLGRSANEMLVKVLSAISRARLPSSDKYGATTVNIGRIEGGVAANVIAETATANVAVRIAAGGVADVKEIVLAAVDKAGYGENVTVEFSSGYGPVDIDHDVEGFGEIVVNYGTDIPNLQGEHKRYLYGPGDILVAHSDHEHLKVSDLFTAVEGYETLVRECLQR